MTSYLVRIARPIDEIVGLRADQAECRIRAGNATITARRTHIVVGVRSAGAGAERADERVGGEAGLAGGTTGAGSAAVRARHALAIGASSTCR